MSSTVVKLGSRNQMVLPKEARDALGIEAGGRVLVIVEGESVRLLPEPVDWADYIYGLGEEVWERLGGGERHVSEERAAWEK